MIETLVLCEGFDDRDFLSGWFQYANGWVDFTGGGKKEKLPRQFGGGTTERGTYYFDDPSGKRRIGILPVKGRDKVFSELRLRLLAIRNLDVRYSTLVVVADINGSGDMGVIDLAARAIEMVEGTRPTGPLPWQGLDPAVEVVSMRAGQLEVPGLDPLERLERVVTAAFALAYPTRYQSLRRWLQERAEPRGSNGMASHWSAMAGWFADQGPNDYLRRAIWQDPQLNKSLRHVLAATGLLEVTQRLQSAAAT